MEEIQVMLTQLLAQVVLVLISYASAQVAGWYRSSNLSKKLDAKKGSVSIAVNAVEQIAVNEGINDKFEEAKTRALAILNSNGLKITDEELNSLIEDAVREMKNSAKGDK